MAKHAVSISTTEASGFSENCRLCPRLAEHLAEIRREYPAYHARPVAPFGDGKGKLLIVGLAPGMHGANATGRPFTGDYAGILLYNTLYKYKYSNQAHAVSQDDGLRLKGCRITNAVKCLPPDNKPIGCEVNTCNRYLRTELADPSVRVILALGTVAHGAVLRGLGCKSKGFPFGHAAEHDLPDGRILLDSYHCSRYNTQTRRLTAAMFEQVFARARALT